MKKEELSGAVAAAQLLANSIGADVSLYSRSLGFPPMIEWKLLPASDPMPEGFTLRKTVSPQPKQPSAGL